MIQPDRGVMTADATTGGNTHAFCFDAGGQMILRTAWHGKSAVGNHDPRHLSQGRHATGAAPPTPTRRWASPAREFFFLMRRNTRARASPPMPPATHAVIWIKQHADAVILNTYTGGFIQ